MSGDDDLARVRRQELIELADRVAHRPLPSRHRNARRIVASLVIGAIGVATIVIGVRMLVNTRPRVTQPTPTLPATYEATSTVTPPLDTAATGRPAVRWIDYVDGVAHLRGVVPDQATADALQAAVTATLGSDHVKVEYVIAAGAPRPTSDPWTFGPSIRFGDRSAFLDTTAIASLDVIARLLEQHPTATVEINAYTDDAGEEWANLALSQQRASAIYGYLASRGIAPQRLTSVGHGEADPIADNGTPEGRAANARIVIVVTGLLDTV